MGTSTITMEPTEPFGDLVPYSDPNWYMGWNSPYYTESHCVWRLKIRKLVEEKLSPFAGEWDEAKKMPRELFNYLGQEGLLPAICGRPWPAEYTDVPAPQDFCYFHELIMIDEAARCGSGGILWGMMGGLGIGLPPLLNFGSDELKATCCRQILAGEKVICLAITEPSAGSDVANLGTTAEKMDDHYLLNGEKKWITNGVFADYFTVACRTGGDGMKGVSLLLVERSEGVETKQMQCMGVWPSGTTYVTFDDVKVPLCNVIGQENKGFKYIMSNFNHERWQIVAQVNRLARVCIEESWNYAHKRKTFGKRLIDHDVIRWKLAEMARQVECTHAMLEQVTYQMNTMEKNEAMIKLGGTTALLKAHSTKVLEYCAREAAQIFGGASYVRGGQGEKIERIYREVRAFAIPGGSEEIMLDLSIKQGMKVFEMTRGMVTDLAKM